jgi:ADP-ribose pyrophosphatase YjhB (NUDIX family)
MNCNNCGKAGHLFHQCRLPITSYGLIVYCKNAQNQIKYLMIRRKDSFGYIDFIRGKYSPTNLFQIQKSINEMSIDEKRRILSQPFEKLWIAMWGTTNNTHFRNEEFTSRQKFDAISRGDNPDGITLKDLVDCSSTFWRETEWEFPKGRRNTKERDVDCAKREFEEETGIPASKVKLIENILPYEETFIGTNHKSYKHKYFVGFIDDELDSLTLFQKSEVSKIEWKTLEQCLACMRTYNLEKKRVISNVHRALDEYLIL